MKRTASAAWSGDLKQGKGSVSTQSGVLKDTQYSFATRFENGIGTFYADGILNGTPTRTRYTWSKITTTSAHWEQAFSSDSGKTWETNWYMDFTRIS